MIINNRDKSKLDNTSSLYGFIMVTIVLIIAIVYTLKYNDTNNKIDEFYTKLYPMKFSSSVELEIFLDDCVETIEGLDVSYTYKNNVARIIGSVDGKSISAEVEYISSDGLPMSTPAYIKEHIKNKGKGE